MTSRSTPSASVCTGMGARDLELKKIDLHILHAADALRSNRLPAQPAEHKCATCDFRWMCASAYHLNKGGAQNRIQPHICPLRSLITGAPSCQRVHIRLFRRADAAGLPLSGQ